MSEEGTCPTCHKPMNVGKLELLCGKHDNETFRSVECSNCGFMGRQWYHLEFEVMTDDEGEEV